MKSHKKILFLVVFVLAVLSIIYVPTWVSPGIMSTIAGTDGIDLGQTIILNSPSDVASWPATATITRVDLSRNVIVDFDKREGANRWPDQPCSWCGNDDKLQYTLWGFVNINGQWYGSGFVQFWSGRELEAGGVTERMPCDWYYDSIRWGPMAGYRFKTGDQLGFMVTAGDARNNGPTNLRERSNVVVVPAPKAASAVCPVGQNPPSEVPSGTNPPAGTPRAPLYPPPETDATTGWNGTLAFNSNNNTWLIVSQHHNGSAILGRIIDNEGQVLGNEIVIDQEPTQFTGRPLAAFAPNQNKFFIVWAQESNTAGSSADIYGRFMAPDGTLLGNAFNLTPNDPKVPYLYPNSPMQYDSRNEKFVFAFENRVPGVAVYLKTVGVNGDIGPTIRVADNHPDFLGAPSMAINEKDNEYCVSYQNSAAASAVGDNASTLAIRRVDASTGIVGPESFVSGDMFFNGSIVYNSREDKYFVVWGNYRIDDVLGKTLNSCNGTDTDDLEDIIIGDLSYPGVTSYNPKSNTYAVISQDCCSFRNNYIVLDTSLGVLEQGVVFTDSRNGRGGNFSPVVAPNTNNGTYGVTSSVDYATTRFVANMGAAVLMGKDYGPGSEFTSPGPKPTAPTEGLPTDLGGLIEQIFTWSLSLLGIAVFMMFFYAGFLWLTAAGNTAKVSEAKDRMKNAVFGVIILLSAYLILYTINPDFVRSSVNIPGLGN